MLRELRINRVAIIDEMALAFGPGMNVLTGETGAGKSIITRAIGLLCGSRASTDLIRTDAEEAEIEGRFELDDAAQTAVVEVGLPRTDTLLVRRTLARNGKGKVTLNGEASSVAVLAKLGPHLIHVYGQHDYALLLEPESHLAFLDQFGKHDAPLATMAAAHAAYRVAAERVAAARRARAGREQRLDLLRFQADELGKAQPCIGEEEELRIERERQKHAGKLAQICQDGDDALSSGEHAISNALGRVATLLDDAARIDPAFANHASTLREAMAQVEDVALDLRRTGERIENDPARLEEIDDRLALLQRLKRKYDCEADALVAKLATVEDELRLLDASDSDIEGFEHERQARAADAWKAADALSRARHRAAQELERRLVAEIDTLGMHGAQFAVVFELFEAEERDDTRLTANGADVVEFHLSANPGEELRPLAKIASGGELSRIMLALKALTAGAGEVGTLIFDEVDTGIGGATAEAVGQRLAQLGRGRQLLSITHLPQIAALADHHLAIAKEVKRGRTRTTARALDHEERVAEIARMLGAAGTKESESYARRLMAGKRTES